MSFQAYFSIHRDSNLEYFVWKIVTNNKFDNIILLLILLSHIVLASEEPTKNPDSNFKKVLWYYDGIFTILFTIEMIIKVIAFGFIWNPDFD